MTPLYLLGLDLGQAGDFTALSVLDVAVEPSGPRYDLRAIARYPLETRYPAIVDNISTIVAKLAEPIPEVATPYAVSGAGIVYEKRPPKRPEIVLVVDYTGVGRPVLDMLWDAQADGKLDHCVIVAITITGAEHMNRTDYGMTVPKRELASATQRVLHEERLRIAESLQYAPMLVEELKNFRASINLKGNVTYAAGADWRDGSKHDDLVLAVSLPLWYGEHRTEVAIW